MASRYIISIVSFVLKWAWLVFEPSLEVWRTIQTPFDPDILYSCRPSLYIGLCVIGWGLTSAMTGVSNLEIPVSLRTFHTELMSSKITHNYAGILSCRVFIGFPEVRTIQRPDEYRCWQKKMNNGHRLRSILVPSIYCHDGTRGKWVQLYSSDTLSKTNPLFT